MANFPLLRPNQAAWIGAVDSSEFWALDDGRHKTINAADGSTHAPAAKIVVGGAGVTLSGPNTISGATTLTNVTNIVATSGEISGLTGLELAGTTRVTYAGRSITREQSIVDAFGMNWSLGHPASGLGRPVWFADTNMTSYLWNRLTLPKGQDIIGWRVWLKGSPGHSALPENMPRVGLYRSPSGSNLVELVGAEATAAAADVAAYESGVSVIVATIHEVENGYEYWLRVRNESGSNAQASLSVVSVRTTSLVTSQDEALV